MTKYIQVLKVTGWEEYPWGGGLRAAKSEYRKVREVNVPNDCEDNRFLDWDKLVILRKWKDGKLQ